MTQPDPTPIAACTISRNVQNFDLLIEDMETAMGDAWGDLGFEESLAFFAQPEAQDLEFVAMAIDAEDEDNVELLAEVIAAAKEQDIKIILIAEDVSPGILHQLLRTGANEFVPYPLPENELGLAIERLSQPAPAAAATPLPTTSGSEDGVLFCLHGLAGGTGSTTLATNLAWELASAEKTGGPSVCLLDLDLQFGSAGTYLDLPRRDVVYELWSDTETMDDDIFKQALLPYEEKIWVLTAPHDMLPLDFITTEDITRVLALARKHFDYVVVDMPKALVQWSETLLNEAQVYFGMIELDMRSAQNVLRLKRALQAEDLPFNKLRFCLNHAPKFTDLTGKSRVKRMAESLEIAIDLQLPDGGRQVLQCNDNGQPLAIAAGKNPLRKEIMKLARSLHDLGKDADVAA